MLLIAGLGNPGRRYAGHRHNIGFMAADSIHRAHGFSPWRARFEGETSEGRMDSEKVLVLKPATFMNESGRSVGAAMRFFKLQPSDVVVIYDELDLPPGKVRMKGGGGRPSHKGLRSISSHIGNDYRRMRIGIGHPGHRDMVNGYVLKDFAKSDGPWVDAVLDAISENAPALAAADDSVFMNKVHLDLAATGIFDGEAVDPDEPASTIVEPVAGKSRPAAGSSKTSHEGALAAGLRKFFGRKAD